MRRTSQKAYKSREMFARLYMTIVQERMLYKSSSSLTYFHESRLSFRCQIISQDTARFTWRPPGLLNPNIFKLSNLFYFNHLASAQPTVLRCWPLIGSRRLPRVGRLVRWFAGLSRSELSPTARALSRVYGWQEQRIQNKIQAIFVNNNKSSRVFGCVMDWCID